MGSLRFLQVSDLRFGAVPPLPELEIDARVRRLLVEDQRRVLERIVTLAGEHRADLVLVAGDLLDDAHATPEEADHLVRALASLSPRPVIIAPGELDPPHPAGYLSAEVLELMGKTPLPSNVTVFRSASPTTVTTGRLAVTGWAIPPRGAGVAPDPDASSSAGRSPLASLPRRPSEASYHVLLAHQGKPVFTALPSPAQLAGAGITYMALGRDPATLVLRDEDGIVRIGWAGHPFPGHSGGGAGGVLLGQIHAQGMVTVELADAGARRAHQLDCDVTGVDPGDLLAHLGRLLPGRGVRPKDLVQVRLTGTWSHPRLPAVKKQALAPYCTHLKLDLTGLTLSSHRGTTVRDLHRSGLLPGVGDPRAPGLLEALRLVDAAWEGGEVTPSGENPSDPV